MSATQANHRSEFGGSLSWSSADTLVLIYRSVNGSMEQTDMLEETFWEYVSVVGAVIDRDRLTFALSDGMCLMVKVTSRDEVVDPRGCPIY